MRNLILVTWLLVPVGVWAFHEGPGQDLAALSSTSTLLADAHAAMQAGDHALAVTLYGKALDGMPKDRVADAQRVRLELAKARMQAKGLPDAREELEVLVDELTGEEGSDAALLADARTALASSQYYMTWLMRLEGKPRETWESEIEAARQNYRLLAEQTADAGQRARHQSDLEAAIRLERMEIEDLQGLPLPSE